MNRPRPLLFLLCLSLFLSIPVLAQTSTSTVLGTVKDPSDAVVAGAEVTLEARAINVSLKQTTNTSGQFVFPNLAPGTYTLKVASSGFKTADVSDFRVEVGRSYTIDFKLEIGDIASVVTVESREVVSQLQTTDASIGNVISGNILPKMPALTRQVNELLALQPLALDGGNVAGSRADQSTFTLDGIDVSNNSIGGTGTLIPLGIDSTEEFRVAVANPTANFGRGAGGQVSVVSKSGSNAYHGVAFWYHQNDNLNANTWTNNRNGIPKPELKDNRFGFNFGGPIPFLTNKTFFFANYEGRRFPRSQEFLRIVPTSTLRQGVLQFVDGAGVLQSYDLATSTACGPSGGLPCDPRGLGLSPTIAAQFGLLPAGNSPGDGDTNNTTGFRGNASTALNNDFYLLRFDHNITSNWRLDASYRYFGEVAGFAGLIDISGLSGSPGISRGSNPVRQNFLSTGLRGSITPNLLAEFRFGWVRTRTATDRMRPNESAAFLAIPGTDTPDGFIALDIGARGGQNSILSEPIDYDTQVARKQANDNKLFQWNADMTWLVGSHTVQFGTHVRYLPTLHLRDDKVLGALGALVAQIDADLGGVIVYPDTTRPPTCSATVTSMCLRSGDVQTWNRLYAGLTGTIDNVSVLTVWDGDFNPLPFGSQLEADTKLWAPEFYIEDKWRITPSFTLSYGFNYGWQQAPSERLGRQSFQINSQNGEILSARRFLKQRETAARLGQIFNPDFAFLPIESSNRSNIFKVDYNNLAPRVSAAWNPAYTEGLFGKLFGNRKTVIRGGYSLIYDRQNTVQSVIVPTLGIAFAQTINVTNPQCDATGTGGVGCTSGNSNPALSAFRVGVDGVIPRPTVPGRTIPVQPFWGITPGCAVNMSGTPGVDGLFPTSCLRIFPEILSFLVDPEIEVGKNHAVNLTWQRDLPGDMLMEIGYAGRFARLLPQSMNLGQSPYVHVDSASGQSFAEAYDAIALARRAGTPAASIPVQPWFENNLPVQACALAGVFVSCTEFIASVQSANFINGNVSTIFSGIDQLRMRAGLQPFNNLMSQMFFLRSSTGSSNYNAVFATLQRRMRHGLTATFNYTFARSLDVGSAIQNAASVMANNFDLRSDYGRSDFDVNHSLNATWLYELPFGRGRWLSHSSGIVDRFIAGWFVSGIFTASSGVPLTVTQGTQAWGGALFLGFASGAIPTANVGTLGDNSANAIAVCTTPPAPPVSPCSPTGLNLFPDPDAARGAFRRIELSNDGRSGRNVLNGMPRWNMDISLGKSTQITEHVRFRFSFDFFNVFNKVDFANPALAITNTTTFGNITSQFTPTNRTDGARWIQFGARVEF